MTTHAMIPNLYRLLDVGHEVLRRPQLLGAEELAAEEDPVFLFQFVQGSVLQRL